MVTMWPGRDVNELSLLQDVDQVPFALRYDARVARAQFQGCLRLGLPRDLNGSRNHVENLVTVWMNLASMRSVVLDGDDTHCHPIDPGGRTRPLGPGGHGEVAMNIEQVMGNIDGNNSTHDAILLLSLAHTPGLPPL